MPSRTQGLSSAQVNRAKVFIEHLFWRRRGAEKGSSVYQKERQVKLGGGWASKVWSG